MLQMRWGFAVNDIVRCSWRRPRTRGAKRCKIEFELDDMGHKLNMPGVAFYCELHELADKLIDDLAVLKCKEEKMKVPSDSTAINELFYRSLKNKKFKKIINEINEFAPLIAKKRLDSKMGEFMDKFALKPQT